jgi:hypothetical protein
MESKIKNFKDFTINESKEERLLTTKQIEWLNHCTQGTWKFNSKRQVDITGSFNCSRQNLTDFLGIEFGTVTRSFGCQKNKKLTSLKGSPTSAGDFYCYETGITSLEGAPVKVDQDFYCDNCPDLITLKGTLEEVGGQFNCYNCPKLSTLMGAPYKVGSYMFLLDDHDHILPENEIYIDELGLMSQWLESKLSAEDFLEKKRGSIQGKKYGL